MSAAFQQLLENPHANKTLMKFMTSHATKVLHNNLAYCRDVQKFAIPMGIEYNPKLLQICLDHLDTCIGCVELGACDYQEDNIPDNKKWSAYVVAVDLLYNPCYIDADTPNIAPEVAQRWFILKAKIEELLDVMMNNEKYLQTVFTSFETLHLNPLVVCVQTKVSEKDHRYFAVQRQNKLSMKYQKKYYADFVLQGKIKEIEFLRGNRLQELAEFKED